MAADPIPLNAPQKTSPPQAWLESRDDRARVLALVFLGAAMSVLVQIPTLLGALLTSVTLALSLGRHAKPVWRALKPVLGLLIPLLLLTPWWSPEGSQPLVEGWSWGPTDLGLRAACETTLRVLALTILSASMLGAVPFDRTIKALQDLKVPLPLTHTALLTYRYAERFLGDLGQIRNALACRGFKARADRETARTFGAVVGGLLVRSIDRTERLEHAMRCRGYAGRLMIDRPTKWALGDLFVLVAFGVLGTGLVVLDRGWVWL